MSAGAFCRASVRRGLGLAPAWISRASVVEAKQPQARVPFSLGDGCEGQAPEGTRGTATERKTCPPMPVKRAPRSRSRAKAGDEAGGTEHARPRPPVEPVSRPVAGRSATATSERMDVTAGETAPVSDTKAGDDAKPGVPPSGTVELVTRPTGGLAPEPGRAPAITAPAPDPVRSPRIDLASAPSGMEDAARQWEVPPRPAPEVQAAIAAGKVWCGPCDAFVPGWFGNDCISSRCGLKARAV